MKKFIISFLLVAVALSGAAQETVYQVDEVSVINYGDGRLLFRQIDDKKTPLQGQHRIIDGYRSECLVAEFKDGMFNGNYQHFKNNKLKEEGTYLKGRKDGLYKEYYSDGIKVKREAPYTTGKLNGVEKKYYTDGKTESEKGYAMSVEEGVEHQYDYESGRLTTDRNYKGGRLDGNQTTYITSNIGDFVQTATYELGKPVGEFSEIFADGSIKTLGQYTKTGQKDGEWLERDSFSEKNNDKFSGRRIVYENGKVVEEEEIRDFGKFQRKKYGLK